MQKIVPEKREGVPGGITEEITGGTLEVIPEEALKRIPVEIPGEVTEKLLEKYLMKFLSEIL